MKSARMKAMTGLVGVALLAGVVAPDAAIASAPRAVVQKVALSGCAGGASVTGTAKTTTSRGVATTVTTYQGEISTTVIVRVGQPASSAKAMASDEAGNEYFAATQGQAQAAALAFNRANRASAISGGVVYYAHTTKQARAKAALANATAYVNGVPTTNGAPYFATSANGTVFFSWCSQARVDGQARLDTNRSSHRVWHATNTYTGQIVTSAVSAKAAAALAAYHYAGYTPGEVAAYGFNCQVLTANSLAGLIAAFQKQLTDMPYSAYGGNFVGYDDTGTNPADMQMFRGTTQAKANALAEAFGKRLVHGGVFVVDTNGVCASVGLSLPMLIAQQNIEPLDFGISPSSITVGYSVNTNVTVNVTTGLKLVDGGQINAGGQNLLTFASFVGTGSTSGAYPNPTGGAFNAAYNMEYYDQGTNGTGPTGTTVEPLTTPFMTTHSTLPSKAIVCRSVFTVPAGPPVTLLSYACPGNYVSSNA
ncbi:MAG: hypothetical protein ACYC1I_13140 [Acidimicrobiales bacterium]